MIRVLICPVEVLINHELIVISRSRSDPEYTSFFQRENTSSLQQSCQLKFKILGVLLNLYVLYLNTFSLTLKLVLNESNKVMQLLILIICL